MKPPLYRFIVGCLIMGVASLDAAAESEETVAGLPPAPILPAMDNFTPSQAEPLVKEYRHAWSERYRLQAAANKAQWEANEGKLPGEESFNRLLRAVGVTVPPGYSWRDEAARGGLSTQTIANLERDGLAIGGPFLKESFQVYTENPQPPFVTSDSLLNAFHVLLEDSSRYVELNRADQLRQILERSWQNINGRLAEEKVDRALLEPYIRHLALVIGPALRLLKSDVKLGNDELEAMVSADVKKIETAEVVELPMWLGPPDRELTAIDYRRCKPSGFYADDSKLGPYYRATRWLQMIPFRLSRDVEVGAIGLMGDLGEYGNRDFEDFITAGLNFWGATGDLNMTLYNVYPRMLSDVHLRGVADAIVGNRRIYESAARSSQVNDQLRSRAQEGELKELSVRLLPATELPDAVMLAELVKQKYQAGDSDLWPKGLEVAAWLGSGWATEQLGKASDGKSASLVPAFKTKRGWSPVDLEALPTLYYFTLASLFAPADPRAPLFMTSESWQRKSVQTALASWAQFRNTWELQAQLNAMYLGLTIYPAGFVEPVPDFFSRMSLLVEKTSDHLEVMKAFEIDDQAPISLRTRWRDLERLTRRLETLAQKQLAGIDWNSSDSNLLKNYGEELAQIMGYGGNSWEDPKDDAPRWTTVFSDPVKNKQLAVAVGRPQAVYVLYPWKGQQILCRGAVMSYYEYPADRRLTDQEWKNELDKPQPPKRPDWIEPLLPKSN